MTKAWRKYVDVMQNACGRTHRGKQSLQRGHINEKYTFSPPILQILGAINGSKIGVIRAIGGPKKLFVGMILHSCVFENHAPQRGREANFQKKWRTS